MTHDNCTKNLIKSLYLHTKKEPVTPMHSQRHNLSKTNYATITQLPQCTETPGVMRYKGPSVMYLYTNYGKTMVNTHKQLPSNTNAHIRDTRVDAFRRSIHNVPKHTIYGKMMVNTQQHLPINTDAHRHQGLWVHKVHLFCTHTPIMVK